MLRNAYLLILLPLIVSCATAPSALAVVTCPRIPAIAWGAPEPAFLPRMQELLSGKLPAPIQFDYSLKPAAKPTTKP